MSGIGRDRLRWFLCGVIAVCVIDVNAVWSQCDHSVIGVIGVIGMWSGFIRVLSAFDGPVIGMW